MQRILGSLPRYFNPVSRKALTAGSVCELPAASVLRLTKAVTRRTPASIRCCVILFWCAAATVSVQAEEVFTLAGTGTKGYAGDGGPAASSQLNNVYGLGRGPDGLLYICDMDNDCVRRILTDGSIETYAGNRTKGYSGDGGAATEATLRSPYEVAWDKPGNLYFVELANHCVRRVDAKTRMISTVAGTGTPGFGGDDGPATQAQLNQPHSLAFDADGQLYVCDILNHRVRRIDLASGVITTWAGTGEKKMAADGSKFTGSPLHGPRAITFAADGTCWLALREGNAVLTLDPVSGTLKRVAGTGKSGFTGNGGPALQATLSGPKGISLGPDGKVYLADTESHSIRYIDVEKGTVELLVGNGKKGDGPDGTSPQDCQLARPHGVFVDKDGTVYIGDSENHRVRVWKK
jgi:sugar lactone lactonase YvrE